MRKLPDELIFRESDVRGLTSLEVAEWNFELQNILAPLDYLSPEYIKKGREFRVKKLGKPLPPGRATTLE